MSARSDAARSYIGALVARRDARRLLDIGFDAATSEAAARLRREPRTLADAIEAVAAKEAADSVDLYDKAPHDYPHGRDAETALAEATKRVSARYARGKCDFCKGPALACARRHALGRSCA